MLLKSVLTNLVERMMDDKLHNKYSESVVVLLGCLIDADFEYELSMREPLPLHLNGDYKAYDKIAFAFEREDDRLNDEVIMAFSEAGFKWDTTKEGSTATYYF